jgi:hypothetical protein
VFRQRIRTLVGVGVVSLVAAASASAKTGDTATERPAVAPVASAPAPVVQDSQERWPPAYIVGRSGLTFGTRTAPLVGAEVGGQLAPFLQVYGAFDWHRDVSPSFVEDVSGLISSVVGADVNYRFPSLIGTGGVKLIAPHGKIRPYGVGGVGFGHVSGKVEVEGKDVTSLLDTLGYLDRNDITFTKALFEVGAGFSAANGPMYIDVSYRFRKFLDTGESINMSGLYIGAGVGF